MDTALFYPIYLNLARSEARMRVDRIIDTAVQFGGCVTVNWHDRSIAPERLWGDVYSDLIKELRHKGAWFATAAQAVAWFRRRRSAVFENVGSISGVSRVKIEVDANDDLPDLQLLVHNEKESPMSVAVGTVNCVYLTVDLRQKRTVTACDALC